MRLLFCRYFGYLVKAANVLGVTKVFKLSKTAPWPYLVGGAKGALPLGVCGPLLAKGSAGCGLSEHVPFVSEQLMANAL